MNQGYLSASWRALDTGWFGAGHMARLEGSELTARINHQSSIGPEMEKEETILHQLEARVIFVAIGCVVTYFHSIKVGAFAHPPKAIT